jgi:hypothetical protein
MHINAQPGFEAHNAAAVRPGIFANLPEELQRVALCGYDRQLGLF